MENANATISRLRREKVVADVNRVLLPIAQEDDNFMDVPPYLFGNDFAKCSKDYVEQVRAMRSTLPKGTGKRPFFERDPLKGGAKSRGKDPYSRSRSSREQYQGSKSYMYQQHAYPKN